MWKVHVMFGVWLITSIFAHNPWIQEEGKLSTKGDNCQLNHMMVAFVTWFVLFFWL